MTGIPGGCALVPSGHADAAAPPITPKNSRLMFAPKAWVGTS